MGSYYIILKYLFVNEYRKEFSAVVEAVSDFFNTKINYFYIHLLSFLVKLINPLILCLVFSALGFPHRLSFILWASIGFCFVAAVVDGNNSAQRVFLPEKNDILLHSALDDNIIHYIIMAKELISYILSSLPLFVIPVYLIFASKSNFLSAFVAVLLFFVSCFSLFIIGIYAKAKKYQKFHSGIFEEIVYIIRATLLSFAFYVMVKFAIGFVFKGLDYFLQGYSFIDTLKNVMAETLSTSFPLVTEKIDHFRNIYQIYVTYFQRETIILTIMTLIFAAISIVLFAQNRSVRYRFKPLNLEYGFKYRLLERLVLIMRKLTPGIDEKVYMKKDLKMILRNHILVFEKPLLRLILPSSLFVYGGMLLAIYQTDNINAIVIASFYTVMVTIFEYGRMLRYNLPFIVLPNAEMRNISLIKISNYGFLKMLAQKVSIITKLSIIPTVIILLLNIFISIIHCQLYIWLHLALIVWAIFILSLSGWFQLYGYCYDINYNYQSYAEMTKLSKEIDFFGKFYIIPKRILDLIYAIFLVIAFYGFSGKMILSIFVVANLFFFVIIILVIVKTIKKGEKYFYAKNIIQT